MIIMNLLPQKEQKHVLVNYRMRLTVVAIGALSVLALTAGVLLLPAYVIATNKVTLAQAQLDQASQNGGSGIGAEDPKETVRKIQATLAIVAPTDNKKVPSQIITDLLGRITPGISLKDIFFNVVLDGGNLTIHGVAQDRKALAAFGESLRTNPLFASTDIPPSSFVKKSNIDFTIIIKLPSEGSEKRVDTPATPEKSS